MRVLEGLIFALEVENTNLKPTQVFAVVPGSPASLVASLLPGDEVSQPDSKRDRMGICLLPSMMPTNFEETSLDRRCKCCPTSGCCCGWNRSQ